MLEKIFNKIIRLEIIVISYLMLTISLLVFLQVITRYVFTYSMPWLEELTRYLMIWMILFGSAYAIKPNKHIGIDIISSILKKEKHIRYYSLFLQIIGLLFSILLTYLSLIVVLRTAAFGQVSGAMRIPLYLANGSFLVGGIFMFLHSLVNMISILRQPVEERGE